MSHADAVGFHRVALAVVVIADCRLVKVCHAPLPRVGTDRWQRRAATGIHYQICRELRKREEERGSGGEDEERALFMEDFNEGLNFEIVGGKFTYFL